MDKLTKAVTIKRQAKRKSGYTVSESNGVYYISEAPAKARVTPGDKVVGINGIRSDEFLDEDDANDLIESIRIVVIPESKIKEFDDAAAAADAAAREEEESSDEEQYEDYDRPSKSAISGRSQSRNSDADDDDGRGKINSSRGNKARGGLNNVPATAPGGGDGHGGGAIQCNHCGHENDDLSVDEDGDYVCEGAYAFLFVLFSIGFFRRFL